MVSTIAAICCVVFMSLWAAALWAGGEGTTSAEEYRKKYSKITYKTVTVPSGAVFKLRSIDQRAFERLLVRLGMSLPEYQRLKDKKYNKMSLKEINQHLAFWDEMIVESVVEPPMSIEEVEGKLPVRLLTAKDIRALQSEISELAAGEAALPMKPLNRAYAKANEDKLTVTKLLRNPADYEGKKVDILALTDGELRDISILNRQKKKIILQRYYITDGNQRLLVLRFFTGTDRFYLTSFLNDAFGKKEGQIPVAIKKGLFTSQLIDEPVIITHSQEIEKVKKRWMGIALKNMARQ